MYYGEIKKRDIANGEGVRVSLFVSGCTHHCKGCFNEETWDFSYGNPFTLETEEILLSALEPFYVSGLTLLGGEPLEHVNQKAILPFLKKMRKIYPKKTVWCYTGYIWEKDIIGKMYKKWEETPELLEYIDVLVDGPFVEEKKNIQLLFRGSENQRLIDVKKSLSAKEVVLWQERL